MKPRNSMRNANMAVKSAKSRHSAQASIDPGNDPARRQSCIALFDTEEPLMFIDGHDNAIIGIAERDGEVVVVYDSKKVIRRLRQRDGMANEDAEEFFLFNILNAWRGKRTPVFITKLL